MRTITTCLAALLSAGAAQAGGLDRSGQSVEPLFEEGRWIEFSYGYASPDVSGTQRVPLGAAPAGASSGDALDSFSQFGLAFKDDVTDRVSYAVIFDQPFGADVDYGLGTAYFGRGSTAALDTDALTVLMRYEFDRGISVHGGLRYQEISASAFVPFVTAPAGPTAGVPYEADGSADGGVGYTIGAAYERPEIALRVAVTYHSEVQHSIETTETSAFSAAPVTTDTDVETPQSINLDFQTGIAPGTLLFGNVRWVDWSDFDVSPATFTAASGIPLVAYENDYVSYSIGLGRQITDAFSAAVTLGYEPGDADFVTNLGPTDGNYSIGVGGTYAVGNLELTAGVRYVRLLDTQSTLSALPDGVTAAEFEDNDAYAVGLSVGYRF